MQSTAQNISPARQPQNLHHSSTYVRPQTNLNTYHKVEVVAVFIAIAWCLLLATFVVASSVSASVAQNQLQAATEKVTKLKTKNSNAKQEISELSSRSRLESIAKDSGLTMNSKNVRNVTK